MAEALSSGLILNNQGENRFLHIEVANVGTLSRTLSVQVVNWGNPSFGTPTAPVGNFLAPVTNTYLSKRAKQFNVIIPAGDNHYEVRVISADGESIVPGIVVTSQLAVADDTGWIEGYTQFVGDYKVVNV